MTLVPITLVVADDHPIVRQGLVSLFSAEADLTVVADVADGRAALDAVIVHEPSVAVMDLRMPVMDGVGATAAVRQRVPSCAVLVLTTYDTDEAIVRAVEAGASGYLLKDTPSEELVGAVRRAAAGETVLGPQVAARLVDRMRRSHSTALSGREIDVLRAVAEGNTNAAIGRALHISQATVKTHLLHIYDKLGVSDRAAAVARAYETGVLTTRS